VNQRVVVKVGGSLLTWPGLREGLSAYWQSRSDRQPVVIVGGGGAADLVRDLDRIHGLGEDRSHHLALRAIDLTARFLASLMPGLEVVELPDELASVWAAGRIPILSPRRFLEADADRPDPLPHTWEATTDSIAARVADRLGAAELALLKSAPLPPGADLAAAAGLGLVDPLFPVVARGLQCVTYRNLRDPAGVATRLPP
jgi:5-(aminomethyl)-3-furanmethanol phosphate kinase